MSGHSKWATIRRKKEGIDAKRGAIFTKLAKNIAVAAKTGKDPDMNPALRSAIDQAKSANMPKDNIEKAILKGAGEVPGAVYEEVTYEAYGQGGSALIIECVTDNTNRTVSSVKSILTKAGGSLGTSGSVKYMFEQKGIVRVSQEAMASVDQDELELALIDAGAEDIEVAAEGVTVITARDKLISVTKLFETKGIELASSGLEWVTDNMLDLSEDDATKLSTMIETLEDDDDVNAVHTNANL